MISEKELSSVYEYFKQFGDKKENFIQHFNSTLLENEPSNVEKEKI